MQNVMTFICFLDRHSGSLTFIVTFVYVLATIAICWANITSANAAKRQLKESKRQYEDTKRLEIMPYLQFEFYKDPIGCFSNWTPDFRLLFDVSEKKEGEEKKNGMRKIIIRNIGNGTATDIQYTLNNLTSSYKREDFPVRVLQTGEDKKATFEYRYPVIEYDSPEICFLMKYKDLLNNCYEQKVSFLFQKKNDIIGIKNIAVASPVLKGKEKSNA